MPSRPSADRLREFEAALRAAHADAADHADDHLGPLREQAQRYYRGEPFGDEQDGRSGWVQKELMQQVAAVMPHLLRVFASDASRVFQFVPRTPRDVEAAEAQTDYINHIVANENDGYRLVSDLLKDALVVPGGSVARWWHEATEEVEHERYTGLDAAQAALLRSDPDVEVVDEETRVVLPDDAAAMDPAVLEQVVAGTAEGQPPPPGFEAATDLEIRRTVRGGRVRVVALPPECFLVERRARSLDEADYVGVREVKTVSDLVAMGFDADEIREHAGKGGNAFLTRSGGEEDARHIGGWHDGAADGHDEATRKVYYAEHYIRYDLDGDDRAELLRVRTVGEACHVLGEPERVSDLPFAKFEIDPTPHACTGTSSFYEQVEDLQRAKSQIMRDTLDALAASLAPRLVVVENSVNIEDVLNQENGSVIRARAPGMVQQLTTDFPAQAAMSMISYLDDTAAQRTGVSRVSQGLDADVLQSTSAVGVNAMTEAASARMEMIARNLAEGFRRMARGLLRTVRRHQDAPKMLRLRERWVEIDPRTWTADLDCQVVAGLGRGDDMKRAALLGQVLGLQQQIIQMMGPDNPIVSVKHWRNTVSDLARAGGIVDSTRYFAEVTPEVQQRLAAQKGSGPPPDQQAMAYMQVEQAKAAAARQSAMQKLDVEAAKAQAADDRERDRMAQELHLKAAEIAAKHGAAVNMAAIRAEQDRERLAVSTMADLAKHLNPQQHPETTAP